MKDYLNMLQETYATYGAKQVVQRCARDLRDHFRDPTQQTIENIVHVLACESAVRKGGKTRLILAHDGTLGIQPVMKDSIRKPVVFPQGYNL